MKKEVVLFSVVFVLLSLSVDAELTPDEIYASDQLRIESNISSVIRLFGPLVDFVSGEVYFFPKTGGNQRVEWLKTNPPADISSRMVKFVWSRPAEPVLGYSIMSKVLVRSNGYQVKKKVLYPLKTSLPAEVFPYLKSTKHIDSDVVEIVEQAKELARGKDDLFVIVSDVAAWVKNNIKYSLTTMTAEVSQPASWALKHKKGVCDELTSLFAAMLRALGVPVKFVAGLSYSNAPGMSENWGPHGWAEVYFPNVGWVPFDVTFGEFGWVDASHVKMLESVDPVEPSTRFEWRGDNTRVDVPQLQFQTGVYEKGNPVVQSIRITVSVARREVGFGSWNVITADVENLHDYYRAIEVWFAKVRELETDDVLVKHIVMRPFERKKVTWMVKVNSQLRENLVYDVPVSVYTLRNETGSARFLVTNNGPVYSREELVLFNEESNKEYREDSDMGIACRLNKDAFVVTEIVTTTCMATNKQTAGSSDIDICMGKTCRTVNVPAKKSGVVVFDVKSDKIGIHQILVTAKSGSANVSKHMVYEVFDAPRVEISNITSVRDVAFDDKRRIHFVIEKKSWSAPQALVVRIDSVSRKQEFLLDSLEGNLPFAFVIEGKQLNPGVNTIKIDVSYRDKAHQVYDEHKEISINLVNVTFEQRLRIWARKVTSFFGEARLF